MIRLSIIFVFILFSVSSIAGNIDSLLQIFNKTKTEKDKVDLLFQIGKEYQKVNIDSGIYYFTKAEKIADKNNIQNRRADIIKNIGNCYQAIGNLEKALEHYLKALDISLKIDSLDKKDTLNKKLSANLYHNISLIKNFQGDNNQAIRLLYESRKLRLEINDFYGLAVFTYPSLGAIYMERGEYSKASTYFYNALDIWEKSDNKIGIADAYDYLGVISEKQNDYQRALQYYTKSLQLREKIGDEYFLSFSYNNIGVAYFHLKNYEKALEFCGKSLEIKLKTNDKLSTRNTYSNIGLIYQLQGDYELSLSYFLKTVEISEEFEDLYETTKAYINVGTTLGYLKKFESAEEYTLLR